MTSIVIKVAERIYAFVALNVLWCFFVLLGLGVFGFMPATVALFRMMREWNSGKKDLPLMKSFLTFYKEAFIRANLYGAMFFGVFYIIYVNYQFVSYFYEASIHFFLYVVIFSITAVAVMTFVNLFSVMAHFDHRLFHYLKLAFGMVFAHPFKSFLQLFWLIAYALVAMFYPKAFLLIGVSVFAYVIMSINFTTFNQYKKNTPVP
ncbi:YesL family protein [Shouchella lehensis]|uniref:DUF624 domain-containing protein n=1 Tax=Shouchella lehensis TaxID=300825 RepID=A0A4Y7WN15_9BACI|nr:DUF624 domain-containing protein [Shouchella lehensis]MBG9783496.1 hypothetical protein [Shouchella lehensis]RQW22924.1 DUF624 domain-containing protein [Bacillus sp. C1-1]TES49757.1 DUF624 domain-containing protein [Shouchella lehensis]